VRILFFFKPEDNQISREREREKSACIVEDLSGEGKILRGIANLLPCLNVCFLFTLNESLFLEQGWNKHTVSFHVDLKALGEAAGLALIAPRHIHDATSVLLAHVIQVPAYSVQRRKFKRSILNIYYMHIL